MFSRRELPWQCQQQQSPISPVPSPSSPLTLRQRRILRNPALQRKIEQMALQLSPLVQLNTGLIHPDFPRTVLQFWLLTDHQLDSLAQFYHQRVPCEFTNMYPCPVFWGPNLSLEDKRRKMGRFIGLRGCESPVWMKTEEEILAEVRMARLAEEDEMRRRKYFDMQWER